MKRRGFKNVFGFYNIFIKRVWYGIFGIFWLVMNWKDILVRVKMNFNSRWCWGLFWLIVNVVIGSELINV